MHCAVRKLCLNSGKRVRRFSILQISLREKSLTNSTRFPENAKFQSILLTMDSMEKERSTLLSGALTANIPHSFGSPLKGAETQKKRLAALPSTDPLMVLINTMTSPVIWEVLRSRRREARRSRRSEDSFPLVVYEEVDY